MPPDMTKIFPLEMPHIPTSAEFIEVLNALEIAIEALVDKKLSFDSLIKLGIMMKEIDKNCAVFKHDAQRRAAEIADTGMTNGYTAKTGEETQWIKADNLAVLKRVCDDIETLNHTNNPTDTVISSSKHPGINVNQADIVAHMKKLIAAYKDLIQALQSPTASLFSDRLAAKVALIPDEKNFYHMLAVAKSEQVKIE